MQTLQDLLDRTRDYLPESHRQFLRDAYEFAEKSHFGQMRLSGEPYIQHPLNAALYLADMHLDKNTIANENWENTGSFSGLAAFGNLFLGGREHKYTIYTLIVGQ